MTGYNTTHEADDSNTEGEYIPKSYQFERDMDKDNFNDRNDTLRFSEESYDEFVYESLDVLLDNLSDLKEMINNFVLYKIPRLQTLKNYSLGRNTTISSGRRRIESNKSDYRIRHNIGGFISEYINGFILSQPVSVTYSERNSDDKTNTLDQINKFNDLNALNLELGFDASRYGKAFEYHYRDTNNKDRIVLIDAEEVFFIYSADVNKDIIAAIHCPIYNGQMNITMYTDDKIIYFKKCKADNVKVEFCADRGIKEHYYGIVPFVEWKNTRFNIGDFENSIPLIDAYDAAQSDTANYMSDLNDALLFLSGDLSALDKGALPQMMDANVILAETGMTADGRQTSVDGKYLYKQYDVAGTEAYKDRLIKDLFKLANVPNMDDDAFGGNQSGVAIEYKLMGLKQIQTSKVTQFTKALRRRYQLLQNIHSELNDSEIDADNLNFTFHPNLPSDVWMEVREYIQSGGEVSQETLRELATFTDNDKEKKRLLEESITTNSTDFDRDYLMRGVNDVNPET